MKNLKPTLILMLTLVNGLIIFGCSREKPTHVDENNFNKDIGFRTIVVQVNTADIKPGSDTEQYVSFANQPKGVSDKDFLTNVSLGDSIVWVGVSTSNPFKHKVNIEQINHHGQDNVLDINTLRAENGKVLGIVKKIGVNGETEKYTIHFKIDKGEPGQGPTYPVDPKLQILD